MCVWSNGRRYRAGNGRWEGEAAQRLTALIVALQARVEELTALLTEAKRDVLRGDLLRCEAEGREYMMPRDLSTRINAALLDGAERKAQT